MKTKTKGALTLSFRGSDLDDFDNGVGQLQVLVNGQLVADVPAGVNNLSGSGDFAPYAETSVNFGPFDITNFTVDGQNTIMFQSPPPGHYGEVKRISITQDGALILSVRDTQAVSLSQSASFTFSLPALVITSLSASGNNPSTGEPVTFTASYQGGTDPISCSFKFGDGQSSSTAGSAGTCSATHAYDNEDTFGVTVLVKGASTSDKAQSRLHLTVQNGDSQDPAPNVDQSSTGSQAPSSDSDQDDD